jgi:hypothetical protein
MRIQHLLLDGAACRLIADPARPITLNKLEPIARDINSAGKLASEPVHHVDIVVMVALGASSDRMMSPTIVERRRNCRCSSLVRAAASPADAAGTIVSTDMDKGSEAARYMQTGCGTLGQERKKHWLRAAKWRRGRHWRDILRMEDALCTLCRYRSVGEHGATANVRG